jgi:RNA polymerase sigma-70 factor (ECF subfamily)
MDPLVERAQKGDATALEELLAAMAPSVHRFSMRMCKDPHDAEDVLQDTLLTIAVHLPESEEHVAGRQLAAALSRGLDSISADHREVLLLRDIEGLSAADAAAALGISVDALKSRLHRAREALREELRPALEPHAPPPSNGCPDVVSMWSQKLEGDLSQRDCAKMEEHIAGCASCGAACDALRSALLACRSAGAGTVNPAVQDRVKAALRAYASQSGRGPPSRRPHAG